MRRGKRSRLDTPCDPVWIAAGRVLVHAYETRGGRVRFGSWQRELALLPMTDGSSVDSMLELPSDEFTATMFDSVDDLANAAEHELRRLYS
jgi:hypothetical protein